MPILQELWTSSFLICSLSLLLPAPFSFFIMSTLFDLAPNNQIRAITLRLALIKHRGDIEAQQREFRSWGETEYENKIAEIDKFLLYIDQAVTDERSIAAEIVYPLPEVGKVYGQWKVLRLQNGLVVASCSIDEASEWVMSVSEFWRKVK